jgi:hypothetical protein
MTGKPLSIAALAALWLSVPAGAVELQPHRASYDLRLTGQSEEVEGGEGRIAIELARPDCRSYKLEYRFVARFLQSSEITVTDQRTESTEALDGARFEFATTTLLDGNEQSAIRGRAENRDGATVVTMEAPQSRRIELPLSSFPMRHTADLVAAAQAGRSVVETPLFDGDDEAEKLLTSTAIITPLAEPSTGQAKNEGGEKGAALKDMKAWRVTESFYNKDSNEDGMPIFETAFTLFENGVSDDLVLKFEGYSFEGGIASLDYLDAPACS